MTRSQVHSGFDKKSEWLLSSVIVHFFFAAFFWSVPLVAFIHCSLYRGRERRAHRHKTHTDTDTNTHTQMLLRPLLRAFRLRCDACGVRAFCEGGSRSHQRRRHNSQAAVHQHDALPPRYLHANTSGTGKHEGRGSRNTDTQAQTQTHRHRHTDTHMQRCTPHTHTHRHTQTHAEIHTPHTDTQTHKSTP